MLEEWKGKRVLITGASRGVGAAVATRPGALGARVAVHYHASAEGAEAVAEAIRETHGEAFTLQGDISRSVEAARLVDEAAERLDGLDLLINNAGDMLGRVTLGQMDDTHYDHVMDLNARSVVMASRAALPHFRRAGRGNIIHTTSIAPDFHGRHSNDSHIAAARTSISMGRLGSAEECVGAYVFLGTDSMSGYITGQVIEVNGGQLMP